MLSAEEPLITVYASRVRSDTDRGIANVSDDQRRTLEVILGAYSDPSSVPFAQTWTDVLLMRPPSQPLWRAGSTSSSYTTTAIEHGSPRSADVFRERPATQGAEPGAALGGPR